MKTPEEIPLKGWWVTMADGRNGCITGFFPNRGDCLNALMESKGKLGNSTLPFIEIFKEYFNDYERFLFCEAFRISKELAFAECEKTHEQIWQKAKAELGFCFCGKPNDMNPICKSCREGYSRYYKQEGRRELAEELVLTLKTRPPAPTLSGWEPSDIIENTIEGVIGLIEKETAKADSSEETRGNADRSAKEKVVSRSPEGAKVS